MTAARAAPVAVVLIACCGALLVPACPRARLIVLDGLPRSAASLFDCVGAAPDEALRITTPSDGAVIPANLAYPLVEWRSEGPADAFRLELRSGRTGLDVILKGRSWRPGPGEFERFLRRRDVALTVYRLARGRTARSAPVRLRVAERPLADRIVFRAVAPLFDPSLPNALVAFAPDRPALATLVESEGTCVGCHAWAGGAAFLNLKQGAERRLVATGRAGGAPAALRLDLGPFSFIAPSPTAGHVVFVHAPLGDLAPKDTVVEPFDYPYRAADLWVLDTRTGAVAPLPGAADPGFVEDMPSFSPDGGRVVFSRYRFDDRAGAERVPSMELAEVPFAGGRGGAAKPVAGASAEGTWNYFARYSPDGRWISFCRGDASRGVYARRSSDIWIVPSGGGAARRLRLNAEGAMDSWHAWSSDSRWLAFSSNRDGSGMTALYLAYVDGDGNDHPPLKVAGFERMKVNTPQFVAAGVVPDAAKAAPAAVAAAFASR